MSALDDVCDALRDGVELRIAGLGTRSSLLPGWNRATVSSLNLSGVISHDVDDQVVEVWAGTTVEDLQQELAKHGQCLPLAVEAGLPALVSGAHGTVGGMLSMNLPHALSAQCGGPRDWTLGMTIVRADGTTAKSGSKAVKSVAGYDAHKLFIGARGTLGLIASIVLRTFPVKALPSSSAKSVGDGEPRFIVRTTRSDFERACSTCDWPVVVDTASCTLWSRVEPAHPGESWAMGQGGYRRTIGEIQELEDRVQDVFDPMRKLAPGWTR